MNSHTLDCRRSISIGIWFLAWFSLAPMCACTADWPMLGRTEARNPVSPESGAPTYWRVGTFDFQSGQWRR